MDNINTHLPEGIKIDLVDLAETGYGGDLPVAQKFLDESHNLTKEQAQSIFLKILKTEQRNFDPTKINDAPATLKAENQLRPVLNERLEEASAANNASSTIPLLYKAKKASVQLKIFNTVTASLYR